MGKLFEELILLIKKNWYRPVGCILLSLLVLIVVYSFLYHYDVTYIFNITQAEVKNKFTRGEIIISPLALFIVITVWRFLTSIPKSKKDTVGIIIAILTENEKEKILLRNDFIKTFREKIDLGNIPGNFHMVEYPEFYAAQVSINNHTKFLEKSKAHFIISGSLKERQWKGKDHYFLKLDVTVRHAPIPLKISQQFAKE